MNVRIPPDLIAKVDAARGYTSRDVFVEKALRLALRPHSVLLDQNLATPVHEHVYDRLVSTEYADGVKMRTHECECGDRARRPA